MTTGAIRRVWVTRTAPGASRTAARLTDLGLEPVVAPLLEVRLIPQGAPDLSAVAAVAFTSRNGVAAFAALTSLRDRPVFAVGDATARAARDAGFAEVRSAAGDLDALARLIRTVWTDPEAVLLHPAAREPAGDLAAAVCAAATVRGLAVYDVIDTGAAPPEAFDAVLVHSPRAARALAASLPDAAATGRVALVISEAAAAPLAALPFAAIRIAASPDEAALFAALTAALGKRRSPV